jgi:hypothetical protein
LTREADIPAGVYIRELADLDLESPAAIGAFVEAYGNPGSMLWRTGPTWNELQDVWRRHGAAVPADLPERASDDDARQLVAHPHTVAYLIDEFVARARLLRDITSVHRYLRGGLILEEVAAGWQSTCTPAPRNRSWAIGVLSISLNWALGGFQPLLEVVEPTARKVTETPRFDGALWGHQPRLFDALNLQLFNDIAAGSEYRRCRNETCRRWFTVVPKGQLPPGGFDGAMRVWAEAMYCSNLCARAQAQREYRRRKAAEKRAAGDIGSPDASNEGGSDAR